MQSEAKEIPQENAQENEVTEQHCTVLEQGQNENAEVWLKSTEEKQQELLLRRRAISGVHGPAILPKEQTPALPCCLHRGQGHFGMDTDSASAPGERGR